MLHVCVVEMHVLLHGLLLVQTLQQSDSQYAGLPCCPTYAGSTSQPDVATADVTTTAAMATVAQRIRSRYRVCFCFEVQPFLAPSSELVAGVAERIRTGLIPAGRAHRVDRTG